jgi:hypothetical protein
LDTFSPAIGGWLYLEFPGESKVPGWIKSVNYRLDSDGFVKPSTVVEYDYDVPPSFRWFLISQNRWDTVERYISFYHLLLYLRIENGLNKLITHHGEFTSETSEASERFAKKRRNRPFKRRRLSTPDRIQLKLNQIWFRPSVEERKKELKIPVWLMDHTGTPRKLFRLPSSSLTQRQRIVTLLTRLTWLAIRSQPEYRSTWRLGNPFPFLLRPMGRIYQQKLWYERASTVLRELNVLLELLRIKPALANHD